MEFKFTPTLKLVRRDEDHYDIVQNDTTVVLCLTFDELALLVSAAELMYEVEEA